MIAYCGIDCSRCDSYLATRSGNLKELEKIAERLSELYAAEVKPEYVICEGCRTDARHSYFCSKKCRMRKCCSENGFYSCIECSEFPCKELQFELDNNPEAVENLDRLKRVGNSQPLIGNCVQDKTNGKERGK